MSLNRRSGSLIGPNLTHFGTFTSPVYQDVLYIVKSEILLIVFIDILKERVGDSERERKGREKLELGTMLHYYVLCNHGTRSE